MAQVTNRRQAMTLFTSDQCIRCHTVRIVLAEKGINYDIRKVIGEQSPEDLLDLNPYNEIPTLVDRDLVLYNHQVIVEYLDERFPHPPLMPVDPVSRGRNRLMLHRIERDWYSLVAQIYAGGAEAARARVDLRDGLLSAVPIFDSKPFFMSDEFSLMDCMIAPLIWRLSEFQIQMPAAAKPLLNYAERIFQRASFQDSLSETERDMRSALI